MEMTAEEKQALDQLLIKGLRPMVTSLMDLMANDHSQVFESGAKTVITAIKDHAARLPDLSGDSLLLRLLVKVCEDAVEVTSAAHRAAPTEEEMGAIAQTLLPGAYQLLDAVMAAAKTPMKMAAHLDPVQQ